MQFSQLFLVALAGFAAAAPAPVIEEQDACEPDYEVEPVPSSSAVPSSTVQAIPTSVPSSSAVETTPTSVATSSVEVIPTSSTAVATPSAAPSVAATSAAASTDYESIVLEQHNVHRLNHSATALTYDTGLASDAAAVAATCVFEHVVSGDNGQNLAAATLDSANQAVGEAITEGWYNGEVELFNGLYGQASPSMANFEGWGHFTQVVWKGTSRVGCATQLCASGTIFSGYQSYFTVCNYAPAGNYAGEYDVNVGEPLGNPTVHY